MITDEQFIEYITKIGNQYEELKDMACKHIDNFDTVLDFYGKLAELRDVACIALRASHTTKNPQDN